MNIFEALEAGGGKATLPEKQEYYVSMIRKRIPHSYEMEFVWSNDLLHNVNDLYLRSNDWIPYVPVGKGWAKPFGVINESNYTSWESYFEICFMLKKYGYNEDTIKNMVQRPINVPRETVKHKKVFQDVISIKCGFVKTSNLEKLFNKPVEVAIEWEE